MPPFSRKSLEITTTVPLKQFQVVITVSSFAGYPVLPSHPLQVTLYYSLILCRLPCIIVPSFAGYPLLPSHPLQVTLYYRLILRRLPCIIVPSFAGYPVLPSYPLQVTLYYLDPLISPHLLIILGEEEQQQQAIVNKFYNNTVGTRKHWIDCHLLPFFLTFPFIFLCVM